MFRKTKKNNNTNKIENINTKTISTKDAVLMREGLCQLRAHEDVIKFAYIQMKIENPSITPEYLSKRKDSISD